MKDRLEAKIQKKIRKRTLARARILRQEKQHLQKIKHTLDALQEVTGLPRSALESIADDAMLSRQIMRDDFFSIKNQILIILAVSSLIIILSWIM